MDLGVSMNRSITAVLLVVFFLAPAAATSPPSEPQDLEAIYHHATNTLELSWLPPTTHGGSAVLAYQVFANGALVATVTDTRALLTDPPPMALYSVQAVNEAGSGPPAHTTGGSNPKCFGILPPDVAPDACEAWARKLIPVSIGNALSESQPPVDGAFH